MKYGVKMKFDQLNSFFEEAKQLKLLCWKLHCANEKCEDVQLEGEVLEKMYETFKTVFSQDWEFVKPWEMIRKREGSKVVQEIQSRFLTFLTSKKSNGIIYFDYAAKKFLDWMIQKSEDSHKDVDVYKAIWAERLAYLFITAYEENDVHRKVYLKYLFAAIKVIYKSLLLTVNLSGEEDTTWDNMCRTLVGRFDTVVKRLSESKDKDYWTGNLIRYKLKFSTDDAELAKSFANSRMKFNKNPESFKELKSYAWVLYDCINQVIHLSKRNLVEGFRLEGENVLRHFEKNNFEDPSKNMLQKALTSADAFLSGVYEARQWLNKGELSKAIATYKEILVRNPKNIEARVGLIELMLKGFNCEIEGKDLFVDELLTPKILCRFTKAISASPFYVSSALFYLWYVEKFGKNLKKFVYQEPAIARALYTASSELKDAQLKKYSFVVDLFRDLVKMDFKYPNGTTAEYELAHLLLDDGQLEEARVYFRKNLIQHLTWSSAWTNYGKTYAKDSIDAAKCFCRAISLISKMDLIKNPLMAWSSHFALYNYFVATKQDQCVLHEKKILDKLSEFESLLRKGIKFNTNEYFNLVLSNAEVYKQLSLLADDLLEADVVKKRGVIVGILAEKLRVWHEGECEFTYIPRNNIINVSVGLPITLQFFVCEEKLYFNSWTLRPDGVFWDIYPRKAGVITYIDYDRGFWRIALEAGLTVQVSKACLPSIENFKVGEIVSVCVVKRGNEHEIMNVEPRSFTMELPMFVRRVTGECIKEKLSRFGRIGEVFVPERLCEKLPSGTLMTVLAVEVKDFRRQTNNWLAFAQA